MHPVTSWAITSGGLSVYRGGALVAVIPARQFGEMQYQLACVQRPATTGDAQPIGAAPGPLAMAVP